MRLIKHDDVDDDKLGEKRAHNLLKELEGSLIACSTLATVDIQTSRSQFTIGANLA